MQSGSLLQLSDSFNICEFLLGIKQQLPLFRSWMTVYVQYSHSWFVNVFVIVATVHQLLVWKSVHILKCEYLGVFLVLFFSTLSILDSWGHYHNFPEILWTKQLITKHLTDAIKEIIVGSSPSFLLTQQCIHHAGQTDTEMFVVYFESFLFIHIYIFTKTLIQQATNRNKQSELQKRGISETNSHPQQKQCTTLSHYAKS